MNSPIMIAITFAILGLMGSLHERRQRNSMWAPVAAVAGPSSLAVPAVGAAVGLAEVGGVVLTAAVAALAAADLPILRRNER